MLMQKVLASAMPILTEKTISDIVIGVSLIGVQLSNGSVGVSYVLRASLPNGCSVFPYVQNICGKPACEIAEWIISGKENLQRGIASAVLAAASNELSLPNDIKTEFPFGIDAHIGDTIGMIGYIRSVAKCFGGKFKTIIFDEGLSLHGGDINISPMADQPKLLPSCDIVLLSGTTTINGSVDSIISMCKNAREIVMVGPSTPMYPDGWKGSGITTLAGSLWDNSKKDEIFRKISLACGVSHLGDFIIKKLVRV